MPPKKQVPSIPPKGLLAIAQAARSLPPVDRVSAMQVIQFLEGTLSIDGAGIPSVVCMLAVVSDGAYPPMDRRVVAGLRTLGHIGQLDVDKLESGEPEEFGEVYVNKVIPAWVKARKSKSAEDVDHAWGAAGMRGIEPRLRRVGRGGRRGAVITQTAHCALEGALARTPRRSPDCTGSQREPACCENQRSTTFPK